MTTSELVLSEEMVMLVLPGRLEFDGIRDELETGITRLGRTEESDVELLILLLSVLLEGLLVFEGRVTELSELVEETSVLLGTDSDVDIELLGWLVLVGTSGLVEVDGLAGALL